MIYKDIPKIFDLDIGVFKTELNYYLNNLPPEETARLEQYDATNMCRMYHNNIYHLSSKYFSQNKPNEINQASSLHNFNIFNLPELHYSIYKDVLRRNKIVDDAFYDHSSFNFFEKTIAAAKSNPHIIDVVLFKIKPNAIIYKHAHLDHSKEYIIHTLLEDMDPGYLQVYSSESENPADNEVIQISKVGDQFMHEAVIPHGGLVPANSKPAMILSVTIEF